MLRPRQDAALPCCLLLSIPACHPHLLSPSCSHVESVVKAIAAEDKIRGKGPVPRLDFCSFTLCSHPARTKSPNQLQSMTCVKALLAKRYACATLAGNLPTTEAQVPRKLSSSDPSHTKTCKHSATLEWPAPLPRACTKKHHSNDTTSKYKYIQHSRTTMKFWASAATTTLCLLAAAATAAAAASTTALSLNKPPTAAREVNTSSNASNLGFGFGPRPFLLPFPKPYGGVRKCREALLNRAYKCRFRAERNVLISLNRIARELELTETLSALVRARHCAPLHARVVQG